MKKILYFGVILLSAVSCMQEKHIASVILSYKSGKVDTLEVPLVKTDSYLHLQIDAQELNGVDSVKITPDFARAKAGDKGYFVFPNGMLCKFPESGDRCYSIFWQQMPISGSFTPAGSYVAIVKGLRMENRLINEVRDGNYTLSYLFDLVTVEPYEDIIVDWYELKGDDADYSGMGRLYRKYQLDRGEVKPLKERVKDNDVLEYVASAPEVRIRLGWKPSPSHVPHQTLQTEPDVHVAMTFDRVKDLIDSLKGNGVERAELCLVGWNAGGHDGRFPDLAPVEPSFGGEGKLKELIAYAKDNGYLIDGHANTTDAYTISRHWDDDLIVRNYDGSLHYSETLSGGAMYKNCIAHVTDIIARPQNDYVKSLGFNGMHFIDCHSNNYPQPCYNPNHPFNRKQQYLGSIEHLKDARDKFGAVQSEGSYDYVACVEDYIMYVTFDLDKSKHNPMVDRYVPLWNIVYNGIILNNAATETVNYTIKAPSCALKAIEFGSRPLFYFYACFRNDGYNWMGTQELHSDMDEDLSFAAKAIAKGCEDQKLLGYLQYEFLEENREIASDVFLSRWSDGSEVVCNYGSTPYSYKGREVASLSYELYK